MIPHSAGNRVLRALGILGAFGALAVLAGCNTPTYGTGRSPELAMIEELTGNLAGGGRKQEPIEYRPRSELVMPPTAQLPAPQDGQPVEQLAAWPNDPDAQRADAGNAEIPEEFRRGRLARGAIKRDPNIPEKDVTEMNTAERLEAQRKFREQRAAMEGSATTRRYLTDPPTEYRQPSPNAPQPEDIEDSTEARTLFGSLWKRWRN